MKIKSIVMTLLILAIVFTGCTDNKEAESTPLVPLATVTPIPQNTFNRATIEPTPKSGGLYQNTGNLGSYENLDNLSKEHLDIIQSFDYEPAYYKLVNEPVNMNLVHLSFWEIGFFADYVHPETAEFINFAWMATTEEDEFLEQIDGLKDLADENSIFKVVTHNGIEYHMHLFSGDCDVCAIVDAGKYFRGEIRWVEDGQCFYVSISSLDIIDESAVELCQIVKYKLP